MKSIPERREGNRYDEEDELKEGSCLDAVRTFQLTQKEQRDHKESNIEPEEKRA